MKIHELKNKNVLILGFGKEGRDTFKFLRKLFPEKIIGIAAKDEDLKLSAKDKKKIKLHLGKDYLKAIKNYNIVVKSPGIPPKSLEAFLSKKQKVTSQTELFFNNCQGLILGVTGTKGKGSTASLIYQILKKAKLPVHLVGNIGRPALSFLFSDNSKKIYVYELSSHQLFGLKSSPQIAVFLNVYADHLDYFKSFKEYLFAKSNIVKYQTKENCLIYNYQDKIVRKIAQKSKAYKIDIKNPSNILKNIEIKKLPNSLIGEHNVFNAAAAVKVAEIFKVNKKDIIAGLKSFLPRTHRLEPVGKFKGIDFYNDSASTIPESTIAAINAFGGKIGTIILGGSDKKSDFKALAKKILEKKIRTMILFPETGKLILKEILALTKKPPKYFFAKNMPEAVRLSYSKTKKGKVCLLSCASASFSIFKNYKHRGELFKKYVKEYNQKT